MNNAGRGLPFDESVDDVLDSAPCGFVSTLPDGTITQVNATFLSWTGHTREDLLAGQKFQDLLTDPSRIFYETHFAPLLATQRFIKESACQVKRKGQEPLQVLVNSSLKLDVDGQPLFIRTIIFDATDRAKYEKELRRARNEAQQLAAIITASSDAIFSLGFDLLVRTWNPGATALYGYTEAEAVGRTIDELIVPKDRRDERARIYDTVRSGGKAVISDTVRRRKDASLVQIELTASPIRDADGQITAVSAIHRDTAERNAVGEALRRSEVRYRRLFEAAHDGVLILDPKTRKIIDANPFMTALLSYTRDQMIGKELYEIGFLADAQASRDMFETLKASREVRYESLPLQNRDGKAREVEVVANLYDENGHSVIQCNVRDITERKQAEVQLKLSEAKLQLGLEVAGTGLGTMDYRNGTITLDKTAASFFDLPENQTIPRGEVHDRFHPDDREMIFAKMADALQPTGNGVMAVDHRIVRRDQSVMWVSARKHIAFSKGPDGSMSPHSGLLAVQDITERKRDEHHIQLLMGEVNHRAKNLLAVVQSIARQTARSGDPANFAILLSERIRGLAASQDLLVKNNWTHIAISELVHAQLSHFDDVIGTRVLLDGPPINLLPSAAQGIGMALHELATNAAKYGALSNSSGRVLISWAYIEAAKPEFTLQWIEEGGPAVTPPVRKGFGHTVIGRMVEASVNGKVEIEYRSTGLYWKLTAPLVMLLEEIDHA